MSGSLPSLAAGRRSAGLWLVFVIGCLLSLAAAWQQQRANQARLNEMVQDELRSVSTRVRRQVLRVELGLLGARGVALTVGWDALTRDAFARYSRSQDLDVEFPGIHGIGVIRRVKREREAAFVAASAADGWPGFAIKSLAAHDNERFVIQYVEPVARNREAIGLDIASESNRRRAALAALQTGQVTLTGPILLMQVSGRPTQRVGFLMLLPVYPDFLVAADALHRADQALGWVYAPLSIQEVLSNLDINTQDFALHIADVEGDKATTFHGFADEQTSGTTSPMARMDEVIAGRHWRLELRALPAFVDRQGQTEPWVVAVAGMLMSTLLAGALLGYFRGEDDARELQAERDRWAVALQTSRDAVVMIDPHGRVFDWNQGAEALFGYTPSEILAQPALETLVPPEHMAEARSMLARAARGESPPVFETQRLDREGRRIDVSAMVVPLRDGDGAFSGLAVSLRDIRQAKQAERDIQQLGVSLQERAVALGSALNDVRSTLNAVPALIAYWDASSVFVRGNRAWHDQFGAESASGPPVHAVDLLGPMCPLFSSRVAEVLAGEKPAFECMLGVPGEDGVWYAQAQLLPDIRHEKVVGYHSVMQDITQQTIDKALLARALRESEAFLSTVHTHALVSVTDRSGRILDANANFCRVAQYTRDELIGHNHRIINSGTHSREFWVRMWQTIGRGRSWRGEICNRARDGSLYWVDSMIAPIPGADGLVERYISIRSDITARKRLQIEVDHARERAEERERFLRVITDRVPLRIAYVDAALRYRFVNQADCDRFGRPRDQIIGRTRAELTGQVEPPEGLLHLEAVLRGEPQHCEYVDHLHERDVVIEAHLVPDTDASGAVHGFFSVSSDITERHEAEQTLRQTMTLLNSVLDASSEVAIIATDSNGLVQVFNRGAERLLGREAEAVVGQLTHLAFHDRAEIDQRREELSRQRGQPASVADVFTDPTWLGRSREWTYVCQDGQPVPVSLILTPMEAPDGSVTGYLAVAIDITQRREFERSLEQATVRAEAANQAKSEFLANMSHEIRTPLNAVLGLTYLLHQTALNAEQRAFLDRIKLASDSLLQTINDVLDLSKVEAGELTLAREPFSLANTIGDLVAVMGGYARSKSLPIRLMRSATLPLGVLGDSVRLTQVLTNLLSNAIKFTERGEIRLEVNWQPISAERGLARFQVSDTGIGLDAQATQRIFEPFVQADSTTTRRFGGTGLGLSIVKQLVELMKGQLGVDSQPGVGSTFWVDIPFEVASNDLSQRVMEQVLRHDALAGKTILVVDDSDINRDVARRIIERKGARVILAEDGEQAVEALRADPAGIDLVLMDIHMPVMDGFEATRIIRHELHQTQLPILALTAGATTDERASAKAVGMDDFITKPFDPARLLSGIAQRLGVDGAFITCSSDEQPTETDGAAEAASAAGWPSIEGVEREQARQRLGDDRALFSRLLRRLFAAGLPAVPLEETPDDSVLLDRAIRDLHRLSGNAGTLGMTRLHAQAVAIESCLRAGDLARARTLFEPMSVEWDRLQGACEPFLVEPSEPVPDGPVQAAAEPLPDAQLQELLDLLRRRSLRAAAIFDQWKPALQARLGVTAFLAVKAAIDDLQFAQAVALLDEADSSGLNSRS